MPPWSSQPIFARSGERFGMFYNPTSVRQATEYDQVPSLTPLQEEALDAIDAIARRPEVRFDFLLRSGEALFVNDHLVLHSRSRFDDADAEEEKRHLLRLWLRSPWLEESLPSSVLFDAGYG